MNYTVYKFNLDLASIGSQTYLTMKQGDTGRSLFITLSNKGQPYEIDESCTAVFAAKKADGNIIFNNCTIEDNTIHYKVTTQTSAAIGEAECEIRLYNGTTLIASPSFTVLVNPAVYPDSEIIESVTEVSTFTSLVGEASELIYEVNNSLENGDFIPKFSVGKVETLPAGSNATVEITGTGANPVLNFGIPQGDEGQAESLIPDTELSLDSTKPVQNKVITAKINDIEKDVADNTEAIKANDNKKVDKENGKALSTNDFTNEYKKKLDSIEAGATKLEDGDVTAAKLAEDAKSKGIAVTLATANWADNAQTVAVEGVTADNNVLVAAAPESRTAWNDAEIYCSAQAAGTLTFACGTVPTADVTANVIILV